MWSKWRALGVNLLDHRRNEEILEEARVVLIAMIMRRRRLEWFSHVKEEMKQKTSEQRERERDKREEERERSRER